MKSIDFVTVVDVLYPFPMRCIDCVIESLCVKLMDSVIELALKLIRLLASHCYEVVDFVL